MGKLQGVTLSRELHAVLHATLALPQPASTVQVEPSDPQTKDGDEASSSSSSSPRSAPSPTSSPSAILERARSAKRKVSRNLISASASASALKAAVEAAGGDGETPSAAAALPLEGVRAAKFLVANSEAGPEEREDILRRLESALRHSALSFAPDAARAANPGFEKRLARLRVRDEERSYAGLTANLTNASSRKDNDVTVKSMMYATSVGLNMVVAPISFGVFMYFFAGGVFARFFDGGVRPGDVDVRRVIAGVVSGVFMLFVEMILFVIRSHELDTSVRRKERRAENRANPFGYTRKNMARVYTRED